MKVRFTDNAELGSYSINIHNNFDHHSHSTEVEECNMDPVKEPVNPYVFIQDYDIPGRLKRVCNGSDDPCTVRFLCFV